MSLEMECSRISSPELTHNDYKLGWICALPKEQTAAMAMLSQIHPELPEPSNDSNSYTLGSINEHNIVIACLPKGKIGTLSAAAVASQMVRTFPSIKVGLMVGIGGGIPPKVRLGDVVISAPVAEYPGVVQWDMGKAETEIGGGFKRTGAMNNPPASLLTALTKLETMSSIHGSQIHRYVEQVGSRYPALASKYTWSGSLKDPLSSSRSPDGSKRRWQAFFWKVWAVILLVFGYLFNIELSILFPTTEEKDVALEADPSLDQTPRKPGEPQIHYGLIASGNQVIKDAVTRDRLNESLGGHVLCVEMEAAGLMDNFPCIVIRGICDYADAQKNKDWQEYAAAVAAACAKELLNYLQPGDVDAERPLKDLLSDLTDTTQSMSKNVQSIQSNLNRQEELEILNWLTEIDYGPQHSDFLRKWQPGTGQWFLESTKYRNWWSSSQQTLFCPGIPGAGKTTLVAAVIQDLTTRFSNDPLVGIAYVYCTFRQERHQRAEDMMSSLLKQLSQNCSGRPLPASVQDLYNTHGEKKTRPSLSELSVALKSVVELYSKTFIIIDALDECQVIDESRSLFLSEILSLVDKTPTNFLATSRPIPEIERTFDGYASQRVSASADDIRSYLDCHMNRLPAFVHDRPELKEEIKASIIDVVDGMFLLARLHLDSLIGIKAPKALRTALKKLPSGSDAYDHAYHEAMERVRSQSRNSRETAEQALAWITYSRRQLSVSGLQHALAVESGDRGFDLENIVEVPDIISVCAGLVTADEDSNVIRLVHYTTQEYLERTRHRWFPDAERNMAKVCATYLSFESFSIGPSRTHSEIMERVGTYKLYQYAANYWGHHARHAAISCPEFMDFLLCNEKVEASVQAIWEHQRTAAMAQELAGLESMALYSDNFRPKAKDTGMTGVHLAAYFGMEEVLKDLLQRQREVDVRDKEGRTPLIWAAIKGHNAVITHLLDHGGDIEAKDSSGRTPLFWASLHGCEEVLKRLIEGGADIVASDNSSHTPMSVAAAYGFDRIVAILLDEGRGYSKAMISDVLISAAAGGRTKVLKELLDRHGNLVRMSDYDEGSLITASEIGHEAPVSQFLRRADSNASRAHDRNPLVVAARNGHDEFVTQFLGKRASLEMKDAQFRMPLIEAARNGHTSTVKRLLLAGADPESRDDEGITPLLHVSSNEDCLTVKLLLQHGADMEATDRYGQTPLFLAVLGGYSEIVEQLFSAGASQESRDADGYTPLLCAARNGKEGVLKILLDNGASIEAEDSEGRTPLFWAAMNGRFKVARMLLEKGAEVDKRNKQGETPLSWAAGNGHAGIVQLLLASGADIEAQDAHGDTPLLWAIWDDHQTVVKILLNGGANWKTKNCYGEDAMIRALTYNRSEIQRILVKARYESKLAQ